MFNQIQEIFHTLGIHLSRYKKEICPERQAVIEAKKHFGNKKIIACEIGTFKGDHALEMLKNLNIEKLYLIDPYEKYEDYLKDGSCREVILAKKKAHKLLEKYSNKIIWIEKYSDEAVQDISEKIDFLYIDGNHFSPYVDNDLENYFPLVKKGGIISGHDYHTNWKDVIYAVNEFSRKINKKVIVGRGWDWLIFK